MMVSYIGTRYNGSQRLVNRNSTGVQDTIQEALEVSLESVFPKKRCCLTAGSRTDKGVHALMNCYTLPLMDFKLSTDKFKRLVNQSLLKRRHEIM
jgi:tRNA pseudouridine(38-40) synthase